MSEADFSAAWMTWTAEPGDDVSFALTVPSGLETGTWTAVVYSDERSTTALVTVTGSAAGQVITFALTDTHTSGLLASGAARFSGYYRISRTSGSTTRTYVKGPLVLPRGRN